MEAISLKSLLSSTLVSFILRNERCLIVFSQTLQSGDQGYSIYISLCFCRFQRYLTYYFQMAESTLTLWEAYHSSFANSTLRFMAIPNPSNRTILMRPLQISKNFKKFELVEIQQLSQLVREKYERTSDPSANQPLNIEPFLPRLMMQQKKLNLGSSFNRKMHSLLLSQNFPYELEEQSLQELAMTVVGRSAMCSRQLLICSDQSSSQQLGCLSIILIPYPQYFPVVTRLMDLLKKCQKESAVLRSIESPTIFYSDCYRCHQKNMVVPLVQQIAFIYLLIGKKYCQTQRDFFVLTMCRASLMFSLSQLLMKLNLQLQNLVRNLHCGMTSFHDSIETTLSLVVQDCLERVLRSLIVLVTHHFFDEIHQFKSDQQWRFITSFSNTSTKYSIEDLWTNGYLLPYANQKTKRKQLD